MPTGTHALVIPDELPRPFRIDVRNRALQTVYISVVAGGVPGAIKHHRDAHGAGNSLVDGDTTSGSRCCALFALHMNYAVYRQVDQFIRLSVCAPLPEPIRTDQPDTCFLELAIFVIAID